MIQSLLKKVKIGSHIKELALKKLQIGRVGSRPIYHPDLLDLIQTGRLSDKLDSSGSVSSNEIQIETSKLHAQNFSKEEVSLDEQQENELQNDLPTQTKRTL